MEDFSQSEIVNPIKLNTMDQDDSAITTEDKCVVFWQSLASLSGVTGVDCIYAGLLNRLLKNTWNLIEERSPVSFHVQPLTLVLYCGVCWG